MREDEMIWPALLRCVGLQARHSSNLGKQGELIAFLILCGVNWKRPRKLRMKPRKAHKNTEEDLTP